jgi:predicted Zn-dependent protease
MPLFSNLPSRLGWIVPVLVVLLFAGLPPGSRAQSAADDPVIEAMRLYLDQNPDDTLRRRQLAERLVQENRVDAAIAELEHLLRLRPSAPAVLRRLAELYDWQNRPLDVLPLYERLLQLDSTNVALRTELARRYVNAGQIEPSIDHLEVVLAQAPRDTTVQQALVQQYLWTGRLDRAHALLTKRVAEVPTDRTARRQLADVSFWTNRPEHGITQLEWLLTHDPDDLDTRKRLAQHYFWTDQPNPALYHLEEVVRRDPQDLAAREQLAQHAFWDNAPARGFQHLEWIVTHVPDRDSLRYALAQRYFEHGKPELGLTHLEILLQRDSTSIEVRRELAQRYQTAGDAATSAYHRERLLDQTPADANLRRQLADQYFSMGAPERGFSHLEILVQAHPEDRALRRHLATRYTEHGHPAAAIDQYQWLVDHPPTDPDVENQLLLHLLWAERHDEVVDVGTRLLAADPTRVDLRFHVARALAWSDRPLDARTHVDTLLIYAPDHVEALLLGGEIQRWIPAEWPDARRKLTRVLALDPTQDRATTLLQDLRRDYGSATGPQFRHATDSNRRTHQYVPLQTDLLLGGHWRALIEVGQHRFLDDNRPDDASFPATLSGYESTVGLQTQLASGLQIRLRGTATHYDNDWTPLGGLLRIEQPIGPISVAAQYQRVELREGASSLDARIHTHRVNGNLVLHLGRLGLSGTGTHAWLSDANRMLSVGGTAQFRLRTGVPALTLRTSYRYEDTRHILPDSRPYWTPDALTTLSGALSLDTPLRDWLHVGATYGLSEQEGRFGNDYGGRLRLSLGATHTLQASLERYGSGTYAYRSTAFTYAYHF